MAQVSTLRLGRPVAAALLYTAGPALLALSPELLAAYKPGLTAAEQILPVRR